MPRPGYILILLLLIPFTLDARAVGEVRLNGITANDSSGQSRLVLDFTSLPDYRVENSGQRVDLILSGTSLSSGWRGQPEDGRVIKVLFARKSEDLIVSFLLRQPPARILTSTEGQDRLVLDLFWQEPPARTAIAFLVPGLPTMQKGRSSATVKPASKHSGNWEEFFREYRTPLDLRASLEYSLPSLPTGTAGSPPAMAYLDIRAMARAGDPYQAKIVLEKVLAEIDERHPLMPYCRLLWAEIALDTEAFGDAVATLNKNGRAWPAEIRDLRQVRLAAALARTGRTEEAIRTFHALGNPVSVLASYPFSLESAADAFFKRGEHVLAADLYSALAEGLADPAQQALARFAWAVAAAQGGSRDLSLEVLSQLKAAFPSQEAGQRAWMKLLDHDVLTDGKARYPAALAGYGDLARQAVLKELREEAAFKQVLILAWSGQQERSVHLLREFLRNFRAGVLRSDAEALLVELLPPVIRDLVERGEDLPAVVLVEQNRQLLMNGKLGWNFLLDLAGAFNRLGLPERAGRIYLFMLESSRLDAGKETLYLPLVQTFWERGEYLQVDKYAARYLKRYPQGKDRRKVFLWRLRAFRETGRLSEAAAMLRSSGVPWDRELELEAARILTAAGDYRLMSELIGGRKRSWDPAPQALLLQAEAMRKIGRGARALALFRGLMDEEDFADQASFRYAQIRLEQGEKKEALKILNRLVETGKSELWRKLAEEMLRAAET